MPQYIYINGYPGIGKFTIAKELENHIPDSKVYHNHLMIDPVAALVERGSPHYQAMRTTFRRQILHTIATSEGIKNRTWIFKDSRAFSPVGSEGAEDYRKATDRRGVPFISIILHCEGEEKFGKVTNETQGAASNAKLVDMKMVRTIRDEERVYYFGGAKELVLDITYMASTEAARRILAHIDEHTD
ncbi:hypothetical protein BJ170DRAFT_423619 [Xylariales sp. AK1849]|nr:hypothetical protein BJ170DRAFT_423619 [Xylariales sp. AK1849]